jgi:hypothetical protein
LESLLRVPLVSPPVPASLDASASLLLPDWLEDPLLAAPELPSLL